MGWRDWLWRQPGTAQSEARADLGSASNEAVLAEWRRSAANQLLTIAAIVQLPPALLAILGYGLPPNPVVRTTAISAYLLIAAAAALRRAPHQLRLIAFFTAAFGTFAVASLARPFGPYAQAGLVTAPIIALVLSGERAAKIAFWTVIVVVWCAAWLSQYPAIHAVFSMEPTPAGGVDLFRPLVLTALVTVCMTLLRRLYRFLVRTLAAEERAKQALQREMRDRENAERAVTAAGDEERRRVGRDLHDGVCQQLAAAMLHSQALRLRVERGEKLAPAAFDTLVKLVGESIDETRNVAAGFGPLSGDSGALEPALRRLARQAQELNVELCEFRASGRIRVADPEMAHHLYHIAREALSNAVRHSGARKILLQLRENDGELSLSVEDDGAGIQQNRRAGGMGLQTMASRARLMRGTFTIAPRNGGGTTVVCRVKSTESERGEEATS